MNARRWRNVIVQSDICMFCPLRQTSSRRPRETAKLMALGSWSRPSKVNGTIKSSEANVITGCKKSKTARTRNWPIQPVKQPYIILLKTQGSMIEIKIGFRRWNISFSHKQMNGPTRLGCGTGESLRRKLYQISKSVSFHTARNSRKHSRSRTSLLRLRSSWLVKLQDTHKVLAPAHFLQGRRTGDWWLL